MTFSSRKKILLVEDQALIAAAQKVELEQLGYEVVITHTGANAVDMAKVDSGIDLILMDIDLGKGIDGTEAARQILLHHEYPIVFLSNHTEPAIVQKTETITSYGYVVKNSGITVLDASIKMAFKLHKANCELQERERRFEALFTKSQSVLLLIDPKNGLIRDANPSACQFYGYAKEKLVTMRIQEINSLPPEEVFSKFNQALQGKAKHFEFRHRLANNEIRDVSVYTGPIDIGDEQLVYSTIHDITEKQEAERALTKEQQRLALIYNSASNLMALIREEANGEFRLISFNQTYWQTVHAAYPELSRAQLEEIPIKQLGVLCRWPPSVMENSIANYLSALETGKPIKALDIIPTPDGEVFLEETFTPVFDQQHRHILYSAENITERKRIELALKASEESLALTLQSIGDAVIATDRDGKVTRLNPTAERLTGWDSTAAQNQKLSQVFKIINAKTRQSIEDPVAKVLKEGKIVGLANDTLLLSKSGREYQIADSAAPIKDVDGDIKGVVLVFRDVTEEYKMREELKQERERLHKAQKMAGLGYWHWDAITGAVETSEEISYHMRLDLQAFKAQIVRLMKLEPLASNALQIGEGIERSLRTGQLGEFEYQFPQVDGGEGFFLITFKGVHNETGAVIAVEGTLTDITKQKQIEQTLQENQSYIKTVLDNLPVGIAVNTDDVPVTASYINENFCRFYRTTPEAVANPDAFWGAVYEDEVFREEIKERVLTDMRSGNPAAMRWENIPITRQGEKTTYITAMNIPIPEKRLMISTVWDVTAQKNLEEELRSSRNFNEALLNSLPEMIYIYDIQEKRNLYSNSRIVNLLGFSADEIQRMGQRMLEELMHPEDFKNYLSTIVPRYQTLADKETFEHDFRFQHKNGQWLWLHVKESVFERTPQGTAKQIFGLVEDITERRKKDDEINRLLREKELLLKEVHHRVKNNMNIIRGLLALQARSLKIPEAIPAFQDAQSRINSMQVLYDKLYLAENYRDTKVKQYLTSLSIEIKELLGGDLPVKIDFQIEDFSLDAKTIFSLGIIVNELLTNTMKHAFVGKDCGQIKISAQKHLKRVTFVYQDNGIGLPVCNQRPHSKGFGLSLIELIAGQLDARLTFETKDGIWVMLEFEV